MDRPEVERRRRRGRPVLMARGLPAGRGAGAWGAAAARGAGPGPAGGRAARPSPLPGGLRPRPCRAFGMAATAAGLHLFPSRTEQLSPPAPMVLPATGGRVGRRHPAPRVPWTPGLFFAPAAWPLRTAGGCRCSASSQATRCTSHASEGGSFRMRSSVTRIIRRIQLDESGLGRGCSSVLLGRALHKNPVSSNCREFYFPSCC